MDNFEIKGNTDIEKAIFLLREIDAFFSFNEQPPRDQIKAIRKSIQEFTAHFPECWECGDSGYIGHLEETKCRCNRIRIGL